MVRKVEGFSAAPTRGHKPQMELSLGMHTVSLKKVIYVLASAVIFLAVFNSGGLVGWSEKLPVGPIGDSVVLAAKQWNGWMENIGATRLHDGLRAGFRWYQTK